MEKINDDWNTDDKWLERNIEQHYTYWNNNKVNNYKVFAKQIIHIIIDNDFFDCDTIEKIRERLDIWKKRNGIYDHYDI